MAETDVGLIDPVGPLIRIEQRVELALGCLQVNGLAGHKMSQGETVHARPRVIANIVVRILIADH